MDGQDPEATHAAPRSTRRLEVPTQHSCNSPRVFGARRFEARCGTWIGYLRRHRRQLLAFLGYPSRVRASWATTNTAEAVNGQLKVLRRNTGGWFQSKRSLECRLALAVSQLHHGRWKSPDRRVCAEPPALLALFRQRFEPPETD